jgi:hypothetical protein
MPWRALQGQAPHNVRPYRGRDPDINVRFDLRRDSLGKRPAEGARMIAVGGRHRGAFGERGGAGTCHCMWR